MKTSRELKEQRANVEAQANEIINKAKGEENRALTDEEKRSIITLTEQLGKLDLDIDAAHAREKLAARAAGLSGGTGTSEEKELRKFDIRACLRSAIDAKKPEGFELEMHQEAINEMRDANVGLSPKPNGVYIPMKVLRAIFAREKRDVQAGSTTGSYAVETTLNGYVQALTEKSRIMQLGTGYITGATGNITYVRENAIFAPTYKTENEAASERTPTFTLITATPKRCADYIDVSNQWLLQTAPEFQARLWSQLRDGIARAVDLNGVNGSSGDNEPVGLLNISGTNVIYAGGAASNGTNADGAAPVYQDAVNMWKKAGNSHALTDNCGHLMSYDLAAKLMNVKIDSGSGKMVWENDSIAGRKALASSHVPNDLTKGSGTALSAWIFGDFTNCEFVQWGGVELIYDNVTQAGSGLTRVHAAIYNDLMVYQPAAFTKGVDFVTS